MSQRNAMGRRSPVLGFGLFALVLLFGGLGAGCGGAYQALPVKKSQALRGKVAGEFDGVTQSMRSIKDGARTLSDVPPDMARQLDMSQLRAAMQTCFNSPVKAANAQAKRSTAKKNSKNKNAKVNGNEPCGTAGHNKINGFNKLPSQTQAFVKQKLTLVGTLRQELRHGLPARLQRLPKLAGSVPLEMAKLMAQAEASHRFNSLLGGKYAQRSARDKKRMDDDFSYIKTSTLQLQKELVNLPKDLASIGGQVVRDLKNFGRQSISGR